MTDATLADLTVRLDVWADIACPWCYIGSRRLEQVLEIERAAGREVVVRHRPFELQPTMPARGVPFRAFAEAHLGGPDGVDQQVAHVSELGGAVGIAFDFAAIPVAPNTRLAHAAVVSYQGDERERDVLLRLYAAYFEQGLDITDRDVVSAVVAEVTGETHDEVLLRIADQTALEAALADGRALGIDTVPLFVADAGDPVGDPLGLSAAAIAVAGAQPARTLAHLLEQARDRATA